MSSLLRKLQRAAAKKMTRNAAFVLGRRVGKHMSLQALTRIANEKERRIARMQERIPALPPGIQKSDYLNALAHMRRTYPERSGRALHDLAVEACVAFEHERQVQRVLAGGKS